MRDDFHTEKHRLWQIGIGLMTLLLATGCSLSFGTGQGESVAAINGAPVVQLAAPLPNSTFLKGVGVNILVAVSNAGGDIQRVEIRVNDTSVADIATPNPGGAARFSVAHTWIAEAGGSYTVTATAFRGDGSTSEPVAVKINVVDALPTTALTATLPPPTATTAPPTTAANVAPAASPTTASSQPQSTPTNTVAAVPSATATPAGVTVRIVKGGMNVRRGPSTNFEPPLGVLPGEQDVPILAANLDATWFKITFNGGEAWISSSPNLVTVVSGDVSSLPREPGPPIPTLPPLPTATTAAAAPTGTSSGSTGSTSGADLVISNFVLDPADPFCNRSAQMRANISNIGNAATATGGFVVLMTENIDGSNRQTLGAAQIPVLQAGQQNFLVAIDFKDNFVSNRGDGLKRAIVTVDANNQIPESNDNNNTSTSDPRNYALGVPCDP